MKWWWAETTKERLACRFRHLLDPYGEPRRDRWRRLLVLGLAAATLVVCFDGLYAFATGIRARLPAPYPIAWLEPLFFRNALQVLAGEPLYAAPSPDYIPSIYNPGFAVAGGLLFRLAGASYAALRLLSLAALLGLLAVLARWVVRETGDLFWAFVTVCLALSVSSPLNGLLTQANLDVPCFFFALLGLLLLRGEPTSRRVVLAALCLALSFAFKQTGALFALVAGAELLLVRRRAALLFAGTLLLAVAIPAGISQLRAPGAYWQSALELPLIAARKPDPQYLGRLFQSPSLGLLALGLFTLAPLPLLAGRTRQGRLLAMTAGAALLAGLLGVQKSGGARNSFLPLYFCGALSIGLAPALLRGMVQRPAEKHALQAALLVLALLVLGLGFAGERRQAETLRQRWARARSPAEVVAAAHPASARLELLLQQTVQGFAGEVFLGTRFAQLHALGRPLNTHQSALHEGTVRARRYDLQAIFEQSLASHRYPAMILWDYDDPGFFALVARYYSKKRVLGRDPFLGLEIVLWLPRETAPGAPVPG